MRMTTIRLYLITNNVQVKDKDTHPGLIPAFDRSNESICALNSPSQGSQVTLSNSLTTPPSKGVQIVHHRVTWFIYRVTWSVTVFPWRAYPGQDLKKFEIHLPREPVKYDFSVFTCPH